MRQSITALLAFAALFAPLLMPGLASAADAPPLPTPPAPKAEVRGQPGNRTLRYWAFARDARGQTEYSAPVVVANAPATLSKENAVVLTIAPVAGATEYGVVTSRVETPSGVKVEVGDAGDRTFFYWVQARSSREVWSPIAGPFKVEKSAAKPKNKVTWADHGAQFSYVYRTETPEPPLGWRACLVGDRVEGVEWTDALAVPSSIVVDPAGTPEIAPEGQGKFLVATSPTPAIADEGQKLTDALLYNLNTTDARNRQLKPDLGTFTPASDNGQFEINVERKLQAPTDSWDIAASFTVRQKNSTGGYNRYYGPPAYRTSGKNTHAAVNVYQTNYTPGQQSAFFAQVHNFGNGDVPMYHGVINNAGQNRTGGDEGAEFFSLHMSRNLSQDETALAADAPRGSRRLQLKGSVMTATDRGLVNLTRAYKEGQARAGGEPDGIRQWYRIERYIAPDTLRLFCYTYWSAPGTVYKGKASADGKYLLCPYTEMQEGPPGAGLYVTPLSVDWKAGDQVMGIAGPQSTTRFGFLEMGGKFLPQDHIAGLGLVYAGDKEPNEGALIVYGSGTQYRWPRALEVHNSKTGMMLVTGVDVAAESWVPGIVAYRGHSGDGLAQDLRCDKEGFHVETLGPKGAERTVSLGPAGLKLHKGTLAGNDR
ncbi:MAG: hypothetical protein NTW19_02115, partial [Planctomycetota bacterium]|nr:hypothetical protein [Planctomycetota bacterium]